MTKQKFDYVIVGAGAAGCVLAYRLTENPAISVALIEAGGSDWHPFFHIPKAVGALMTRPRSLWTYPTEPEASTANKQEYWLRGRVLGGSTSVNGLMYVRGQPADFDAIADLSSSDWDWRHIGAAYAALERHELGAGQDRGGDGLLKVSLPGPDVRSKWHEAILQAGANMGLPIKEDVNVPDNGEGIGYNPRTVSGGWRQSAAKAFLRPARKRSNLTVITHATCDKVIFEGKRAVAVSVRRRGKLETIETRGEIIIAGGAMSSPGILERSGIGDPAVLQPLGIPVVVANPNVGAGLLEHRALHIQFRVKDDAYSANREHRGWRLGWNILRLMLTQKGILTSATFDMGAWLKSRPGLNRPDTQFLIAPQTLDFSKMAKTTEPFPGMALVTYPLRPQSAGTVHITSTDPEAQPKLVPNHRATEADRQELVASLRVAREFVSQPPLRDIIVEETRPGPQYQTDQEVMDAFDLIATCGYHAVGSCRMSNADDSVVDPALRVRGVEGLRVMDTSIMPTVPSGNTQGPTMAMAWRAADVIRNTKALPEQAMAAAAE